ncbi:MAG TPA: RNHCP domain-containing protein [Actinomycetota bacterium]|nr:RNHCP domain-containing protein [Actinomycetota bacterium]
MSRDRRRLERRHESNSFRCHHCRVVVSTRAVGTDHRNHCPNCLWSRHLDDSPGDRSVDCGSLMEPIAISVRGQGEWVLIHRCTGCEALHLNRTAGDDDPLVLLKLAVQPLARPPFPIERIGQL